MRNPLIGITPSPSEDTLSHGTFSRLVLNAAYANAVSAAGGIPVILPYSTTDVTELLDRLDGVLLSGGADMDPARFGVSKVHPTTYGVSADRDEFELTLLREALSRDIPVLGICRGIQVLNVGFGGTLIQDIASEYGDGQAGEIVHRQHEIGIEASQPGHSVTVSPGNPLHDRVGVAVLPVNSFHHQAIDRLGAGLVEIARAGDGIIEAVACPDRQFVLGVQWHPELMFNVHPAQLAPFEALVAAAKARAASIHEALV